MSDEFKHTPGPWIVESGVITSNHNKYLYEDLLCGEPQMFRREGGEVCSVKSHFNYDTREYNTELEKANARLIAAAPEMLEVLIKAYRSNEHWGDADYHKWNNHFKLEVINIIEKATGLKIEEILK